MNLLTSVVEIKDKLPWRRGTILQSIPILSLPLIPSKRLRRVCCGTLHPHPFNFEKSVSLKPSGSLSAIKKMKKIVHKIFIFTFQKNHRMELKYSPSTICYLEIFLSIKICRKSFLMQLFPYLPPLSNPLWHCG